MSAVEGVLVIYSAMSGQPFSSSALSVIFNEVSVRGFWLAVGQDRNGRALTAMYDHLVPMVASGESARRWSGATA